MSLRPLQNIGGPVRIISRCNFPMSLGPAPLPALPVVRSSGLLTRWACRLTALALRLFVGGACAFGLVRFGFLGFAISPLFSLCHLRASCVDLTNRLLRPRARQVQPAQAFQRDLNLVLGSRTDSCRAVDIFDDVFGRRAQPARISGLSSLVVAATTRDSLVRYDAHFSDVRGRATRSRHAGLFHLVHGEGSRDAKCLDRASEAPASASALVANDVSERWRNCPHSYSAQRERPGRIRSGSTLTVTD
jgi:hypothetical protein